MPDEPATSDKRPPGNWRHRENRASPKYVAKRVSLAEHALINEYADSLNVAVADLLAPAVEDLLTRARAHQSAHAS
jgi:hypothetical protein